MAGGFNALGGSPAGQGRPIAPGPGPGAPGLGALGSGMANPANPPGGGRNALGAPGDMAPDNMTPPKGGSGRAGPMQELMAAHDHAKAVYGQVTKARNLLDHMRREMDQLTSKGDVVSPQDVIAAAGRVVGHGAGATEMATILSSMPSMAGQGLAAWLAAHDVGIRNQEAHVDQMKSLAQHQMGVAALRVIAGVHMTQRVGEMAAARSRMGILAPSGRVGLATGPGARPAVGPPGMAPQGMPIPAPNVLQTMQRPTEQGPAGEEAV